ncbi:hypothetical protein [Bifidobacterium gallicum]|uniref:Uncharacterized protein n=1 Tax=Bifidobacterium gallicum DSM 20093 = LMG 11596 TaxID=561180 RepID=D1NRV0_9BIFI|nr:hypothetical protein [Bifidobacterium gallicum]EFA23402.1 hypothetical protein BIFGAL_02501 [Bifidobacterium gallicum DSM 20093 = LMG 11596]KFI57298.1 hypothetical protein BGLCM_1544 [Bifidobacterium gallicum DSM 20093 = LMG 11596]
MGSMEDLRAMVEVHMQEGYEPDTAHLETLADDLHACVNAHGYVEGIREWCQPAMRAWMSLIDHTTNNVDMEAMTRLIVAMNEAMSVRDALITTVLTVNMTQSRREALVWEVMCKPFKSSTSDAMGKLIMSSFEGRKTAADICSVLSAAAVLQIVLEVMADIGRFLVQPSAVIAFLLWWLHMSDQSEDAAHMALDIDEDCGLATIVLEAIDHGVYPKHGVSVAALFEEGIFQSGPWVANDGDQGDRHDMTYCEKAGDGDCEAGNGDGDGDDDDGDDGDGADTP